ncbi:GTP cyclohydrolase FolE2 [Halodesulfovibrio sp.]|uniref:GTP cyclohydrolase FolE2 n=1 Tax=Halodesulfovibrio sp. TaxID=1912772 RepID=UPI0025F196A7|nr:GTP cyclohydrolase FolE2 [Halodesulfovibrio sp.]MCT4535277.1 GTP cyclohydrolase FolE2 [Halodesulfovibrio sp.]MCT4627048.1 GTP cyclohydrolase FolE2 [Halodesulfovibrio sp.]
MQDIQMSTSEVAIPIDSVGVKNLRVPLSVRDRENGAQHTVADVEVGVDLPAAFKGTHMSRFVESLESFGEKLDYNSLKELLMQIQERLSARNAFISFTFPYFMTLSSPATKRKSRMNYEVTLTGALEENEMSCMLEACVPVMTVCPCSKAISDEGAHSQRAEIRLQINMNGFAWIEEFIEIANNAGSSPVYSLLKREDEKYVTEYAFANPTFVEDVVRAVAQQLSDHEKIDWYRVEVESFESIHNHSAYAVIESK